MIFPLHGQNGIGLSPDEATLFVAETDSGRLWAFDVPTPGVVAPPAGAGHGGRCIANTPGHLDSLAVEADSTVVAAAISAGLCVAAPDGSGHSFVAMPDPMTTNLCFGGPDLSLAYVTLSGSGRLIEVPWPRRGLRLAF